MRTDDGKRDEPRRNPGSAGTGKPGRAGTKSLLRLFFCNLLAIRNVEQRRV